MIKTAMLLPAGVGVLPEEILISDYQDIQRNVGGNFDVVRFNAHDGDGSKIAFCGYVHDEGLLDGLELNYLASGLFGKPLVGPCVVTFALSPNGEYDGDDYDMPEKYVAWIKKDLVLTVSSAYNYATLMEYATTKLVESGKLTEEDVETLMTEMDRFNSGEIEQMSAECEMMVLMIESYLQAMESKLSGKIKDAITAIVSEELGDSDE